MISATAEFGTSRFSDVSGNSMQRTDVLLSFMSAPR